MKKDGFKCLSQFLFSPEVLNIVLEGPFLTFIAPNNTHVCSSNDLLVDFSRDTCGQVELSWGENQSEIS